MVELGDASADAASKAGTPIHEGSKIRSIMRKTVVTLGLAFGFLAGLGTPLRAQPEITFTPGADTIPGLNEQDLRNKLNELFQAAGTRSFLRKFGDAQSFTSKGLGVDYASEATYFEVGGSASFALGMDRTYQPSNTPGFPISGVGLNASLMGGLSLGFLGIPVMVFGNWMKVPTQNYGAMSGSLDNWGVHAQVRLFGPSRSMSALKMLVRWGGIAVTTGLDYSHMSLGLKQPISSKFTFSNLPDVGVDATGAASGDIMDVNGAVVGTAHLNIDMTTKSIPLEVTTSLRLLTLLTAYGGLGFDWQLGGGSNMDVGVDAKMVGHTLLPGAASGSKNPADYSNLDLGTAHVKFMDHAEPSAAKIRGIMGLQINLFMLRIFTQMNITNTNPVMASLAVGARVAY